VILNVSIELDAGDPSIVIVFVGVYVVCGWCTFSDEYCVFLGLHSSVGRIEMIVGQQLVLSCTRLVFLDVSSLG